MVDILAIGNINFNGSNVFEMERFLWEKHKKNKAFQVIFRQKFVCFIQKIFASKSR